MSYTEEIINLCNYLIETMIKEESVNQILRVIEDDAFQESDEYCRCYHLLPKF